MFTRRSINDDRGQEMHSRDLPCLGTHLQKTQRQSVAAELRLKNAAQRWVWISAFLVVLTLSLPNAECLAQCNNANAATTPVTVSPETSIAGSRQIVNGVNSTVTTNPGTIQIDVNLAGSAANTAVTVLASSTSPSVSTVGAAGSSLYHYVVVAKDSSGNAAPIGLAASISSGNATLTSSNYNQITWSAVSGAASYDVYRIGTSVASPVVGKLANTTSTSYSDQSNSTGDGTIPPAVPTRYVALTSASASTQLLDCTNGNIVVTLPDSTGCSGTQFIFKRQDNTTNTATLLSYSAQHVAQNQIAWVLYNKANPLWIQSDGTANWRNLSEPSGAFWSVAALPPKKARGATDWGTDNMIVMGNDGKIYGWGLSTNGNLADGNIVAAGVEIAHPVAFDPNHPPASGAYIVDWAASDDDLFVVFSDGTVYGAGQNADGQLGLGNNTASSYLQKISSISGVVKVWTFSWGSYAGTHGKTFFSTNTGALYACGYNTTYALGFSLNTAMTSPSQVPNIFNPSQIRSAHSFTGGDFTLLCDAAGGFFVTGYNLQGQLGTGATTTVQGFTSPTGLSLVTGPIVNVFPYGSNANSVNANSSAILASNGVLYTAGTNTFGQLGHGNTTTSTNIWYQVASSQLATQQNSTAAYATGSASASGSTVTGTGTSWSTTTLPGTATSLQIGFGSASPASITTWYPIASINSTTSISLAASATIASGPYVITAKPISQIVDFSWEGYGNDLSAAALDSTGGVWTWGYNGLNNLFYANTSTQAAPTKNVTNAKIIGATSATSFSIAENCIYWDGSQLHIGGTTLDGLVGVTDASFTSGSVVVSLPESISSGAESISDFFVNNNNNNARLFILTDHGNLYATGDNSSSVCTGGVTGAATVGLFKVGI